MSAPTMADELARNLEELAAVTREARADRWRVTMEPMTTKENGR